MATLDDFEPLRTAVQQKLGASLDALGADPIPVLTSEKRESETSPLWALKIGQRGIVSAKTRWVEPLRTVVERFILDELFSIFGAYEMARITLADGVGIWGPSWYYVGDERTFRPPDDERPVQLSRSELAACIDVEIFWHCPLENALAGFAIFEDDQIVALATVNSTFERVWEIGIEVVPQAKGRGLGRAVVGAAGRWILQNDRLIMATTAPWNVPSARTLRSVGLECVMTDMITMSGHFHVPPQPLGQPYPDAQLYNHYPDWAMNQHILPKIQMQ